MEKIRVAIVGPGNIGTDLLFKIRRSNCLDLKWVIGIKESEGIRIAKSYGIKTNITGLEPMLEDSEVKIVFDATSAAPHIENAPLYKAAGKIAIDLTPASVGPFVVPSVNIDKLVGEPNINMVTCGGQATVPIVYAVHRAAGAEYAEIVACISSKSAGPGTRQNIDEFTQTTANAICKVGGAKKGKAIIVLNPAEPPIIMTNTIYVKVEKPDCQAIEKSVMDMVKQVGSYVPGYRLRVPPLLEDGVVTVIVEVEGKGDFLPKYSGNLDIMNCAAVAAAERLVAAMSGKVGR
ncbi:MAG TPA: acetaldehyde dehydrogenase (acetylating) [Firmicutes bacterium]|nr:acetaldehyde dehydrogenase (acetylating) [Bacillota bacterium]